MALDAAESWEVDVSDAPPKAKAPQGPTWATQLPEGATPEPATPTFGDPWDVDLDENAADLQVTLSENDTELAPPPGTYMDLTEVPESFTVTASGEERACLSVVGPPGVVVRRVQR